MNVAWGARTAPLNLAVREIDIVPRRPGAYPGVQKSPALEPRYPGRQLLEQVGSRLADPLGWSILRPLPRETPMRILLIALFALSGAARAVTLDELLAKNLAARGGAANVQKLQTLRLTGRAVFSGMARRGGTIETAWAQVQKRPGKIRSEVTRQGLTAVQAWNGKEGWKLAPFDGRREPERASQDDARAFAQDADIEGQLVSWREKGSKVEYLGIEDVDGTPAHKLRVALKDGDVQYVFLDPDAFLHDADLEEREGERRARGRHLRVPEGHHHARDRRGARRAPAVVRGAAGPGARQGLLR